MGVNYGTYAAPRLDLGVALKEHLSDMSEFIADKVLPVFRTTKKAASFSAITRESILQDSAALRAARSAYNRIDIGAKDKSYACKEYGLEGVVDDQERALYESDFDAEMSVAEITTRALMLQREKRAAAAVFDTALWTGANYFLDTAVTWATPATADPIGDILFAKEKVRKNCGMVPNALILNEDNVRLLQNTTQIKNQFPGAPLITLEMLRQALASIFGLTKLIVAGAVRNSAIENQTAVIADVWSSSNAMIALVADEGAPLQTPCIGRSFLWVPDSPNPVTAEMYREEQSRGDIFRARHSFDENIFDKNFAFLLKVD